MNQDFGVFFSVTEERGGENPYLLFRYLAVWQGNQHPILVHLDTQKLGFYYADPHSSSYETILELDFFRYNDEHASIQTQLEEAWNSSFELKSHATVNQFQTNQQAFSLSQTSEIKGYSSGGAWGDAIPPHKIEESEQKITIVLSLPRLVLDFLFDYHYGGVFQLSPAFPKLKEVIHGNQFLYAMLLKAEVGYHESIWRKEKRKISQGTIVTSAQDQWANAYRNWKAHLLKKDVPAEKWFNGVETEMMALVKTEVGLSFPQTTRVEKGIEIVNRYWARYDVIGAFRVGFSRFAGSMLLLILVWGSGGWLWEEYRLIFLVLAGLTGAIWVLVELIRNQLGPSLFAVSPKLFFTLFSGWLGYAILEDLIEVPLKIKEYAIWLLLGVMCLTAFMAWLVRQAAPELNAFAVAFRTALMLGLIGFYTVGIGVVFMNTKAQGKIDDEAYQLFVHRVAEGGTRFEIVDVEKLENWKDSTTCTYSMDALSLIYYKNHPLYPPLMLKWGELRILPYHLIYYSLLVAFFGLFLNYLLPGKRFTDW